MEQCHYGHINYIGGSLSSAAGMETETATLHVVSELTMWAMAPWPSLALANRPHQQLAYTHSPKCPKHPQSLEPLPCHRRQLHLQLEGCAIACTAGYANGDAIS